MFRFGLLFIDNLRKFEEQVARLPRRVKVTVSLEWLSHSGHYEYMYYDNDEIIGCIRSILTPSEVGVQITFVSPVDPSTGECEGAACAV